MKIQIAILLVGLLPSWVSSPALAETAKTNTKAAKAAAATAEEKFTPAQLKALAEKRRKWMLAQRSEYGGSGEAAWQLMKQPLDLPNLPQYTGAGAVFVEGLMYPNKPGGAAFSMTFRAKEAPDVVLDWYQEALANYKWKITPTKKGSNTIDALNGSNGVTVKVTPTKAKGFRTDYKISFKLSHK